MIVANSSRQRPEGEDPRTRKVKSRENIRNRHHALFSKIQRIIYSTLGSRGSQLVMRSGVTTVLADRDSPPLFTNCWVQRSRLTWNSHMLGRAVLPYPGGFRITCPPSLYARLSLPAMDEDVRKKRMYDLSTLFRLMYGCNRRFNGLVLWARAEPNEIELLCIVNDTGKAIQLFSVGNH